MGLILFIPHSVSAISDTASSSIVMDIDSGRVLYEKNADQRRLIASITKIMTAVVALENGNLDDIVTVGEEVLTMYGSNIYIELNEKMTLRDLLYGLLLRSGNDAAIVIAKYIGKDIDTFVQIMNDKAKEIGMENTTFSNPHGLDEETKNYSTARDMAKLSSYAYHNETYKEITGTKKYVSKTEGKTYLWNNRNKLLSLYEYATGGKTGYTPSAGRTLVTTAFKDGLNLTCVTLNDPNEYDTHESLYEYSFNTYTSYKIINQYTFHIDKTYYKDNLYVNESFAYPLKENEVEKVKTLAKVEKLEKYKDNDQVGEVIITMDNKEIKKVPIFVKVEKEVKKSFWQKIISWFKFW